MANGWTEERRKRQSMIIHYWNPSGRSTGPKTDMGKSRSSLNAMKHGNRSKHSQKAMSIFKKIFQLQALIQNQVNEKSDDL